MKRLAVTVAAAAALGLSASAAAVASSTTFNGFWTSTDVGDGSSMFLYVSGGSTKAVAFYDTSAHACLGYSNRASSPRAPRSSAPAERRWSPR
jgi:hypothetical protein